MVYIDNKGGELLSKNQAHHVKTKHICVKYHYVRQQVKRRELVVKWIAGKKNLADMLTKALTGPTLREQARQLLNGSSSLSAPTPSSTSPTSG